MNGFRNLNTMIRATKLTKSFGNLKAVDDVSMNLEKGVTGFLGPNGAGKSTTMRLLCGYMAPDLGSVFICDHDVIATPRHAQASIGYLPEAAGGFCRWLGCGEKYPSNSAKLRQHEALCPRRPPLALEGQLQAARHAHADFLRWAAVLGRFRYSLPDIKQARVCVYL